MTIKPAIAIKNLTVGYQQTPILHNLNFVAHVGSLIAIMGPNGSGKTTLLQSIMGIIPCTGDITIFDQPHITQHHKIAYIAQRSAIDWTFPASVFDIVIMGRYGQLKFGQRPTATDKKIAYDALQQVSMLELADYPIGQLSGGQQQRVFLARALAQQAEMYILDEPFIGIDMTTEKIMLDLFLQLKQEQKTIIVVHHDLITVQKHFDTIFFMNKKEIASGPIATTMTPENIAKTFHSAMNIHDFNIL